MLTFDERPGKRAMKRVDADVLGILLIDVQPFFLEGWMAGAWEPFMRRIEHLLGLATAYIHAATDCHLRAAGRAQGMAA